MMGKIEGRVEEDIFQLLFTELQQNTRSSDQKCREVADRIAAEVNRICQESQRIKASGEEEKWRVTLSRHRLQQCLFYYNFGARGGRVELHSTLSAMVYRYITPPQIQSSYQARLNLIEDFLQGFYVESLNAFRREAQLEGTFSPTTLLELSEYMAFTERYAKRRIPLSGGRSQQLLILRAQTFSQQQPPETTVDMEQAAEGSSLDSDQTWNDSSVQQVRNAMVDRDLEPADDSLRETVIKEVLAYLQERGQNDCADYFILRLQDLPTNEIEEILGVTPRQRDYLQQRFKYHLIRFALSHRWELVHEWLEADLERNLGLTPERWQQFQDSLEDSQRKLLRLKQQGAKDSDIAKLLECTVNQVQKRWFRLLEAAWHLRNERDSGNNASTDE
ncbi:heterocyst differentiation protein HetZ [Laspinema olomoucense]|uniref:heterocyst differentiation protein HetZ n=1 Tax=Laspinema olomoucense TaxID=3231600 RepID=UPI0021BB17C5|nr:heterocyst differentiation protein HetZ [Laspinema sp. D3a]MCT7988176.1 heterocyst differentiation protein HetZ [Laspinema sp. D3a]